MRYDSTVPRARRLQRGLTLIEFMISIVLGMVVVAAMAVLIANQSTTRAEVDRAGRLIENGRYALQTMADDLQMAGYWGEIYQSPDSPTSVTSISAMPDPCSVTINSPEDAANPRLKEGTFLPVQAYDGTTFTSSTLGCVSHWKSGTDVVVVRRVDPVTTTVASLTEGQVYLQTGLSSATGTVFGYVLAAAGSDATANATTFNLVTRTGSPASIRKLSVHIYYVSSCDVCTGSAADTIPTLKRVELGAASGSPSMTCSSCTVTIAEGVENLQVDFGYDTNADGAPDSNVNAADASFATPDNWRNVVSAKAYILARSTETSPSFTDTKTYTMGTASVAAPNDSYQRHLFSQSVRLANPSLRRSG